MRFHLIFSLMIVFSCGGGGGGGENKDTQTLSDLKEIIDIVESISEDKGMESQQDKDQIEMPQKPDPSVIETTPEKQEPLCPPVFTGSSCNEFTACALQCEDESYKSKCLEKADTEELKKYDSLYTCLKDSGCEKIFEKFAFSKCAIEKCGDKIEGCFMGSGSCNDIRKCVIKCDQDDLGCPMMCFGLGDKEAQEKWIEYKNCIFEVEDANNPDNQYPSGWPNEKTENFAAGNHCPSQYNACVPPIGG